MQTIQFETVVNGSIIQIPDLYKDKIHSGARVKVLTAVSAYNAKKPNTKTSILTTDDFTALRIDTREFKFDRL